MKTAKFLFYVINGIGIGHLTRLISIANKIRLVAPSYAVAPDIFFVTTSDAIDKLQDLSYPVVKIPSIQGMRLSQSSYQSYRKLAFRVVTGVIECLQPDMLVVDTIPSGKFDEFVPQLGFDAFAHCRRSTFIHRPVRNDFSNQFQFREAITQYDLVLIPEFESTAPPPASTKKVLYTGPVISFEINDLLSRAQARRKLGINATSIAIYVSTGGGGHPDAADFLGSICKSAASIERARIFLAPGPLFKGIHPTGRKISLVGKFKPEELFPAMDMAVSAAGYNTFNELMAAGVPTVFAPLSAGADDQYDRAMRAVKAGAGQCVAKADLETHTAVALSAWLSISARLKAAAHARTLIPENGAKLAAHAILQSLLD